jgi:hypothetical protein
VGRDGGRSHGWNGGRALRSHHAPAQKSALAGGVNMTKSVRCCVSVLALVIAAAPACHGEQRPSNKHVSPRASSLPNSTADDCETRIQKLDASETEGEERLAEKNEVIGHCATQYKGDKVIERLVKECAKYEEQPVVKQQSVAECQLAAFNYANALRTLKTEYRK